MLSHKFLFLSIIAFTFSVSPLLGQKRVNEGYIITVQGDTTHGELKDLDLKKSAVKCSFRESGSKKFTEYRPGEIHSFRYGKKYFISKEVIFDDGIEFFFIEFLVDGIMDLYYLQHNNKLYYLIEDDKGLQTLMAVNSKTVESNEDVIANKKDRYKQIGTLKTIMKDYPPIFREVDKVYIEDNRSMKKLMVAYHEGVCSEYDCIDYTKSNTESKMFIGFSFGLKVPSLQITTEGYLYKYLEEANLETSPSYCFGIDFSTRIPRLNRFGIHAKFELSKEKFKYTYSGAFANISTFSYNNAALLVNFNYMIGSGNIRFLPYVGLGFNSLSNQDFSRSNFHVSRIRFKDFMMTYTTGGSIDIPLIKDKKVHIRTSVEYRFSLRKKINSRDITYCTYNAPGISIMLLKYL